MLESNLTTVFVVLQPSNQSPVLNPSSKGMGTMILFIRHKAAPVAPCYGMKLSSGCLFPCGEAQQTPKVSLVLLTSDECQQFDIFVSQGFILVFTNWKMVLEMKYKI